MSEPPSLPTRSSGPPSPPPRPQQPAGSPSLGDDPGMRVLMPVGRSGWAIAAGYLALFSVLLVPAPFALVCGILAVSEIRKTKSSPHPKHGMGRAVFGIVMGVLGTALLAVIIFGSLMEA